MTAVIDPRDDGRPAPSVRPTGRGNDDADLSIVTGRSGSAAVEFDFAEVAIGTAEYSAGPTGCTVISLPAGVRTAVDARGGGVGLSGAFPYSHAICLSGGSSFGFAAGAGVADELLRSGHSGTGFEALPVVNTAVIYDFAVRSNAIHPDAALGRAALRSAMTGSAATGRVGAGVSATVGKLDLDRTEWGGQGVAFAAYGPVKLLVVTVVNAVGVVVDRTGRVVRGNRDPLTGSRSHPAADYAAGFGMIRPDPAPGNTTITAVITNLVLDDRALTQFARQVHGSMHRAIQPFHTPVDGDVLFAATTDQLELPTGTATAGRTAAASATGAGILAAEVAWDAVLRAVS